MYDVFDIYKIFRKAQSEFSNRGYRLPKDWESHYANKMVSENKRALETITGYFNTKWQSINPEQYFSTGFTLFGNRFSYRRFLDKKIILQYIQNDKNEKRKTGLLQEDIKTSASYVNRLMTNDGRGSKLIRYCNMNVGCIGKPVDDYIAGRITKTFMVLLIWHGIYKPTEEELNRMPYVTAHYHDIIAGFDQNTLRLLCAEVL